jgi:hypothetical protein
MVGNWKPLFGKFDLNHEIIDHFGHVLGRDNDLPTLFDTESRKFFCAKLFGAFEMGVSFGWDFSPFDSESGIFAISALSTGGIWLKLNDPFSGGIYFDGGITRVNGLWIITQVSIQQY